MILILPVFLGIVFTIMEIGYVSFQLILLNHATFEVARIGGMTCKPNGGCDMRSAMQRILPAADVKCNMLPTLVDSQAGQQNYDLSCTGTENVKLIFPISSVILAKPGGTGKRALSATVFMPIEQPLPQ